MILVERKGSVKVPNFGRTSSNNVDYGIHNIVRLERLEGLVRALNMKWYSVFGLRPDFVREIWKPERFYDLLEQSDGVSVCCPLTGQTRDLFDREAFRRMRPHALLVNVTKGPIVDAEALLECWKAGMVLGRL